jgi:hypothetical protein
LPSTNTGVPSKPDFSQLFSQSNLGSLGNLPETNPVEAESARLTNQSCAIDLWGSISKQPIKENMTRNNNDLAGLMANDTCGVEG